MRASRRSAETRFVRQFVLSLFRVFVILLAGEAALQFTLKQLLLPTTVLAVPAALVAGGYCIIAFLTSSLLVVGLIARDMDRGRRGRAFMEFLLLVSTGALVAPAAFAPVNYRVYFDSPGFEPADISVRDFLGDQYDLRRRAPIEPIRIELKRTSAAPGQNSQGRAGGLRIFHPPAIRMTDMDENPYKAPVEDAEPAPLSQSKANRPSPFWWLLLLPIIDFSGLFGIKYGAGPVMFGAIFTGLHFWRMLRGRHPSTTR